LSSEVIGNGALLTDHAATVDFESVAVGALVSKVTGNGVLAPAHAAPLSVHLHYRGHLLATVGNLTCWECGMEAGDGISGDYEVFSVHFSFFFASFSVGKRTTSPERWSAGNRALTRFGHFRANLPLIQREPRGAYYPHTQNFSQISKRFEKNQKPFSSLTISREFPILKP
jgi:hypothetical protein